MSSSGRIAGFTAACAVSLAACAHEAPQAADRVQAQLAQAKAPGPAADPNWALVERVRQALARDTAIPDDIDVSASGGVVSLWGRVNNEKERRRAAEIAAAVGGVQRVENKLVVKTD